MSSVLTIRKFEEVIKDEKLIKYHFDRYENGSRDALARQVFQYVMFNREQENRGKNV